MSKMIDLHSSACLKEIPQRVNLNKVKKRQGDTAELHLGFAFEDLISAPRIKNKTKSKGTEIAVPKSPLFFASFTSTVEFDLTKTQGTAKYF